MYILNSSNLYTKSRCNAVKDSIFLGFFFNVVIVFCGLSAIMALMLFFTFVFVFFQL